MNTQNLKTVSELRALPNGDKLPFSGVFLLRKVALKKAKNGSDFLSVELGDNTGSFVANCWANTPPYAVLSAAKESDIVEIAGETDYYREAFSPKLHSAQVLEESQAVQAGLFDRLVKVSPENPDALWAEFQALVQSIAHEGLRQVVQKAMKACGGAFRVAPAAVAMHQAYRFGLLEHTVHVARVAKALLPLYPEVDPSLAMAGSLLHDIGKVIEYGEGRVPGRTREGHLQGHVVLGYRIVRRAAMEVRQAHPEWISEATIERLEHIVLSHQGALEWGAAVLAATPEAVFVSMADNFDAKMSMVQQALRESPQGAEFSDFLKGLNVNLLLTPVDNPAIDEAKESGNPATQNTLL